MPDLMPDTSIYRNVAPQGGLAGALDLGALMGIAQRARELQTQSAVSGIIKQNIDPGTGQVNWMKAGSDLQKSGAYLDPQTMQGVTSAANTQADLQTTYMKRLSDLTSSVLGQPGKLTKDRVMGLANAAERSGLFPPGYTARWASELPDDDAGLRQAVTQLNNYVTGGSMPETKELPTGPGGKPEQYTGPEMRQKFYGPQQGGGGAAPFSATPPGRPGGLPIAAEAPLGASAALSAKLTDPSFIPQQRNILQTLDAVSKDAGTGPTAEIEKRINELGQRFGIGITQNAKDLAKTEEYAKLAEQIVQQSPAYGHSDAFLRNQYGANPNLQLSKLGREGITQWLLGNVEAQKAMIGEWQKWLSMPGHQGLDNQFQTWLRSKRMGDGSPGFDAANFDPRVFQYMQLSSRAVDDKGNIINPRQAFRKMFKDQDVLARHIQEYSDRGMIPPIQ